MCNACSFDRLFRIVASVLRATWQDTMEKDEVGGCNARTKNRRRMHPRVLPSSTNAFVFFVELGVGSVILNRQSQQSGSAAICKLQERVPACPR